jgi:hypothetical protein
MNEQKKQWQKPVLIVIGRSRPEEQVLAGCKTGESAGMGHPNKCMTGVNVHCATIEIS